MPYTFKILISTLFFIIGFWIIIQNWILVFKYILTKKKQPSWIPLAGGFILMLSLGIQPFEDFSKYWLIPFILDWGCIPGFIYTLIFYMKFLFRRKNTQE
jgi:hypothetical protein